MDIALGIFFAVCLLIFLAPALQREHHRVTTLGERSPDS